MFFSLFSDVLGYILEFFLLQLLLLYILVPQLITKGPFNEYIMVEGGEGVARSVTNRYEN